MGVNDDDMNKNQAKRGRYSIRIQHVRPEQYRIRQSQGLPRSYEKITGRKKMPFYIDIQQSEL